MQIEQNDEINLLSLLKEIWDGKWKIFATTVITSTIALAYIFYTPNSFKVSSTIKNDKQNIFVKFKTVNDILLEFEQNDLTDENKTYKNNQIQTYRIDADMILDKFLNEFNDYAEMIDVLKKNAFVINKIKNLNDLQKQKLLIGFANNFKIKKITKNKNSYAEISFFWHDIDEGTSLIKSALDLTLLNVKDKLLLDINSLASSLDDYNQRQINFEKKALYSIRETYNLNVSKRTTFLTEHSSIAKELGISDNILNNKIISMYIRGNSDETESYDQNIPYYLHGYKAIDKEIELINNRSKLEKDIMTNEYINIKEKLLLLENDERSNELKKAAKFIKDLDNEVLINSNLEFAEVENLKKSKLYISFSVLIGLVMGVLYVILYNIVYNKR